MSRAAVSTGFFGKIPAAGDFMSWNLPRAFTDRWDRWMSRDLLEHPCRGPLDPRAWRFTVPAGIFCDAPCAGVWRMSEDRAGRRYPFLVARVGPVPHPGDVWFDEAVSLLEAAIEAQRAMPSLTDRARRLPSDATAVPPRQIAFWLDDWEVHEFAFADIHDLAAHGLPRMRAPRAATEPVNE